MYKKAIWFGIMLDYNPDVKSEVAEFHLIQELGKQGYVNVFGFGEFRVCTQEPIPAEVVSKLYEEHLKGKMNPDYAAVEKALADMGYDNVQIEELPWYSDIVDKCMW